MMNRKYFNAIQWSAIVALSVSGLSSAAFADNGDGFKLAFNLFFGKESERNEAKSCANMDSGGGGSVLQGVNVFFCQLEKKYGITQAPTSGSPTAVTKVFGGRTVHVEIVGQAGAGQQMASGYNNDGSPSGAMGYDYMARVWVCKASGSVTCATVTDFKPAVSIAYSYSADGSINKGNLLQDPSARDGLGGGAAISIVYNTGSDVTNKKIAVRHLAQNGDKMRVDGSIAAASKIMSVQLVQDQSSSARRFSAKVDGMGNTASAGFAQNIALSDSATAADPVQCFNRVNDGVGDWSYILNPSGVCSIDAYVESVSAVNAYTSGGILKVAPSDANWSNGMTPTPVIL